MPITLLGKKKISNFKEVTDHAVPTMQRSDDSTDPFRTEIPLFHT